ncbi:unnamed protein product [Bursaphelenchus xylophilus]|uniref:(pine wood nematode) hypothetical protein n=1 Tax=Bursaphelenchus xylophilus TaxID=6326 RepID=A0A1I7RK43_BURXY|nr:unnamed protein product [Bursaphelenchus xylophilus]CAG9131521.1 unnamed protein product [Bursaphelenchus xylophilus]
MPKSSLVNEGHSRKCQNTRDFDCPERQRKPRRISRGTHLGLDAVDSESEYDSEYSSGCDGMHAIRQCESGREEIPPAKLCVRLNDMEIALELDTGAARTVIPERVWRQIGHPEITRYTGILQEYGGSPLEVIGAVRVNASFRGHQKMTEIIVVRRHDCQPTLGRDLMKDLKLDMGNYANFSLVDSEVEETGTRGTRENEFKSFQKASDETREVHWIRVVTKSMDQKPAKANIGVSARNTEGVGETYSGDFESQYFPQVVENRGGSRGQGKWRGNHAKSTVMWSDSESLASSKESRKKPKVWIDKVKNELETQIRSFASQGKPIVSFGPRHHSERYKPLARRYQNGTQCVSGRNVPLEVQILDGSQFPVQSRISSHLEHREARMLVRWMWKCQAVPDLITWRRCEAERPSFEDFPTLNDLHLFKFDCTFLRGASL